MRFLAGHLPGVERDLADDFDGQLRATDSRIGARIVIGAGDGMVYIVLADLDSDGVVVIRDIEISAVE
jgi:hypothetical protein